MRLRILFACILLVMARPAGLHACSCSNRGAAAAIESADAVFSGRLVAQRVLDRTGGPDAELTFRVDRYWKGGRAPTVVLLSWVSGPCTVTYPLGEHLLVYGHSTEHGLEGGGFCSRIRSLHDAGEDLSLLGRGWRPGEPLAPGPRGTVVLTVGLLLAALVLTVRRRGRATHA
jgi:hypothetical protein